ncbi:MAG: DUF2254 family protein [Pseudomonadales bacterium]|jgi:hypothetical protein|nr:DUF2254 family protein [Pseudomonadales bacterium]
MARPGTAASGGPPTMAGTAPSSEDTASFLSRLTRARRGPAASVQASVAVAVLFAVAMLMLVVLTSLDGLGSFWLDPLAWLAALDPVSALDTLSNAAEVVAGVLAIAITVVAIVVQLAATRYTHRIASMFVREPVNVVVISFFVLTTIQCVWVSASVGSADVAAEGTSIGLVLTLVMVTLCLLILLPYFAFVFVFVSPLNIIDRIRRTAARALRRADRDPEAVAQSVMEVIENLEDIARGAIDHGDRSIAMGCINALMEFLLEYDELRDAMPDDWFALTTPKRRNPDFISVAPAVLDDIETSRTWLDVKILRQYQTLFSHSLNDARDICNLIALNTTELALYGLRERSGLLHLSLRFLNSFMRAAINAKDLRTAYHLMNHYREVAQCLMEAGDQKTTLAVAEYFKYYGQIAYNVGQPFLLEAVTYDLTKVLERAVQIGSPMVDPLLDLLLTVDRESKSDEQEESLLGVRRAQVQLATLFLAVGDEKRAKRIQDDMMGERRNRLLMVRDELLGEERQYFWEFNDRGVNFAYLPPERRAWVDEFFKAFPALAIEPPAAGY